LVDVRKISAVYFFGSGATVYSRMRDIYQALALPLGSDADLCRYLLRLFEDQQEMNREPLSPASAAILRELYEVIHSHSKDGKYAQKDLTAGVNLHLECHPMRIFSGWCP
jgi:hypothetical protein